MQLYRVIRADVAALCALPYDLNEIHRLAARDPEAFRPDIGLGLRLRLMYSGPFLRSVTETDSPRDQMLRGRFTQAVPQLVKEQERWKQLKKRRSATSGPRQLP